MILNCTTNEKKQKYQKVSMGIIAWHSLSIQTFQPTFSMHFLWPFFRPSLIHGSSHSVPLFKCMHMESVSQHNHGSMSTLVCQGLICVYWEATIISFVAAANSKPLDHIYFGVLLELIIPRGPLFFYLLIGVAEVTVPTVGHFCFYHHHNNLESHSFPKCLYWNS